jgi:hypothetical protein
LTDESLRGLVGVDLESKLKGIKAAVVLRTGSDSRFRVSMGEKHDLMDNGPSIGIGILPAKRLMRH